MVPNKQQTDGSKGLRARGQESLAVRTEPVSPVFRPVKEALRMALCWKLETEN